MLFVVDRKDLDYQTMREYDRFEKGAANSNTSTAVLKKQLEDPGARIIITTIQKLATSSRPNKGHAIYDGHVVIIFDECHRSQFGDMHTAITKAFKRYHLFGFTGTPIFAVNAGTGGNPQLRTTEQAFGDRLHTYTIVDAINDKNVLPFRIDYVNTIKLPDGTRPTSRSRRSTPSGRCSPRSGSARSSATSWSTSTRRPSAARALHARRQAGRTASTRCSPPPRSTPRSATTPSSRRSRQRPAAGPAAQGRPHLLATPPTRTSSDGLPRRGGLRDRARSTQSSRDFLEAAIQDYNAIFGTSFDTSSDKFQNYYKDLSLRLKNREIDLVIVVNMFLTGFDATTLNTLWVDKNLRAHGLIQAYSRTNRILNSVKTYGNIVTFRDLEEETNDAIALFGNKDARGIVLLKPYADYYAEYAEQVAELLERFPLGAADRRGERAEGVHRALRRILRLQNILTSFDEFAGNEILTRAPVPGLPQRLPRPLRRVPHAARTPTRSRSTTTSSSRSSSSSRSRSTSTTS